MTVSRRAVLHVGIGGTAAALIGAATSGAAAASSTVLRVADDRPKPRFPGDPGPGKLYYGASTQQDLAAWEQQMGQRLALHRTYYQPAQVDNLVRVAAGDLAAQRFPHVSTKCPGSWAEVARGKHDAWLRNLSGKLGDLDRPLFLTPHHEPENDAPRKGNAADFVAMQTHIIEVFRNRAPKVTIVPVLMGWSFSKFNRKANPKAWYVPAAKVYGVDVYNPYCVDDPKWVSFVDKLRQIKPYARGKPIAIGEYGCRNDPNDPSRGAAWMRQAFRYARNNDIVAMSYFNSGRNSPEGTWELDGGRSFVFERRLASAHIARPAAS